MPAGLIDDVVRRAGLTDRAMAARAVEATLAVLAERVIAADRRSLADALPDDLGAVVADVRVYVQYGVDGFYERLRQRLRCSPGVAIELAQVVCRSLGQRIDAELATRLQRHLPGPIADLLVAAAPAPSVVTARHAVVHGRGLAAGRPGSAHPISESAPRPGQADSVAVAANPHEQRKLSSGGAVGRGLSDAAISATPVGGTRRQ